jgi:hypothetical protein
MRRRAKGIPSVIYGHPVEKVTTELLHFLGTWGIPYTLGRQRGSVFVMYRTVAVHTLQIRVGILQGPWGHNLVLVKGVCTSNEDLAWRLLRGLDAGLYRRGEAPDGGVWL